MRESARRFCVRALTPQSGKPGTRDKSRRECRWSSAIPNWWKPDSICWTFPTIIFYESGYSLHTLRQASRRSWRIGQRRPVRVKFLCYEGTMQTACLRLMGKKLLVALTMEGKFAGEGLQNIDEDDDMLSAMARELVERNGIGETADSVWKALNYRTSEAVSRPLARCDDVRSSAELPEFLLDTESDPAGLVEGAMDHGPRRRLRPATSTPCQAEAAARSSSCPGTGRHYSASVDPKYSASVALRSSPIVREISSPESPNPRQ